MDRTRLALLIVCGLLTTSLASLESTRDPSASTPVVDEIEANVEAHASNRPAASSTPVVRALPSDFAFDALEQEKADEALAAQILARLEMRHTALPPRERMALVHAIIREARANALDPGLVVAVIEVESAGYHLALSHVGAMGLMQLLPSTGKEVAEEMGIEWKGADTLYDPIINVRLGTAYLSQLATRYGSVDTALAAYNWGPGRIDRRIRRGATVPSRYIEQVMSALDRSEITLVSRS